MNHYEIVLLVHPDRSDEVSGMVERYRELVDKSGGKVHRYEDWGRRQLAYAINKVHKAHYLLLNIEVTSSVLDELGSLFRFNDAVLRNLVIKCEGPISDESPMAKNKEEAERASQRTNQRSRERDDRGAGRRDEPKAETTAAEAPVRVPSTVVPTEEVSKPEVVEAAAESSEPGDSSKDQASTTEAKEPIVPDMPPVNDESNTDEPTETA